MSLRMEDILMGMLAADKGGTVTSTTQGRHGNFLQDLFQMVYDPAVGGLAAGSGGMDWMGLVPEVEPFVPPQTPQLQQWLTSGDPVMQTIAKNVMEGKVSIPQARQEIRDAKLDDGLTDDLLDGVKDLFSEQQAVQTAQTEWEKEQSTKRTPLQDMFRNAGLPDPLERYEAADLEVKGRKTSEARERTKSALEAAKQRYLNSMRDPVMANAGEPAAPVVPPGSLDVVSAELERRGVRPEGLEAPYSAEKDMFSDGSAWATPQVPGWETPAAPAAPASPLAAAGQSVPTAVGQPGGEHKTVGQWLGKIGNFISNGSIGSTSNEQSGGRGGVDPAGDIARSVNPSQAMSLSDLINGPARRPEVQQPIGEPLAPASAEVAPVAPPAEDGIYPRRPMPLPDNSEFFWKQGGGGTRSPSVGGGEGAGPMVPGGQNPLFAELIENMGGRRLENMNQARQEVRDARKADWDARLNRVSSQAVGRERAKIREQNGRTPSSDAIMARIALLRRMGLGV
jgi:hypothetical protein